MDDWLSVPDNVLLSLRRQTVTGQRMQWAVMASGDQVVVQSARFGEEGWSDLDSAYSNLAQAVTGTHELREVRKGAISEYSLDREAMKAREFVRLLDLRPEDGDESPDDWPEDVASEWAWVRACMTRFGGSLLLRWASINGDEMWITGVQGRTFSALAIDEYEGGYPESQDQIASCWWAVEGIGAPMSWAGGYLLERVAPELACSRPYNDEVELAEDGSYQFIDMSEESKMSFAEGVARWIIDRDAEVGAALSFEEFDPDDTLDEAGQRAWNTAMSNIELGVTVEDEVLVQASLTEFSDLYCSTRDAMANPTGELGRRMLAAYNDGIHEIRGGSWAAGDLRSAAGESVRPGSARTLPAESDVGLIETDMLLATWARKSLPGIVSIPTRDRLLYTCRHASASFRWRYMALRVSRTSRSDVAGAACALACKVQLGRDIPQAELT